MLREERVSTSTPLLTTKLYIPPTRAQLISRPRLIERLAEGLTRPLTLISAPAGSGKTTLIGEWRTSEAGHGFPLAWLSLDAEDNDPARFLTYLIAAWQTLHSTLGESALALLHSTPPAPPHSILASLINDLAGMPAPFAAVLDDYHCVVAPPIHDALAFLLDHLPPQMHLIIATRADPPLPLARLRARDHLTEIRAADLRFTPDEAAAFFSRVMRLNLSAGDSAALAQHTEGWIAGLQLAALSLQGSADVSGFIAAFTGSQRYIVDYLIEEVLERQPELTQSFLLLTSILERMTGPLCDALTGRADGLPMLHRLEQANLFVTVLDHERHWYRYHPLFAEVLRSRLRQTHPERLAELHRRAADWHEQNGTVSEAIGHALSGQDQDHAARLIEQNAMPLLMRGEVITLLGWIKAVEALLPDRPWLAIYQAWVLTLTGQLDRVESVLLQAERWTPSDDESGEVREMLGHIAAIRAYLASQQGDARGTIDLARQALEYLPENETAVRSVVAFTLGGACWLSGDVADASRAFAEAGRLGKAAGNVHVAVPAICSRAELLIVQGQLQRAAAAYREALHIASTADGRPLPVAARAHVGLSQLLYEWGDLEAALQMTQQGIELGRLWGNVENRLAGHVTLARIKQAQGDLDSAQAALSEAEQLVGAQRLFPLAGSWVEACRARLWLAQGNLPAAVGWAQASKATFNAEPSFAHEPANLAFARVLQAQGAHAEALTWLERLLHTAEATGRWGRAIEILVLQALSLQAEGDAPLALTAVQRALSLAQPEGYVRLFLDEGTTMRLLISDFRFWIEKHGGARSEKPGLLLKYVDRLLAAFPQAESQTEAFQIATPKSQIQNLVEPLSERELEVLRLVAAGKSNQEIARELVLAVGTVKKHVSNISGKLNAQNRTQCVARARELNLL
jgi:LuxR family maltose regulon positive regulatory protein